MVKTHSMSRTKFHAIWYYKVKMCKEHQRYIKGRKYPEFNNDKVVKDVCERWLNFATFKDDMINDFLIASKEWGQYNIILSRKDELKPYCKDNCFFTESKEVKKALFEGRVQTFKKWSDETGIPLDVIETLSSNGANDEHIFERFMINGLFYPSLYRKL